VAVKPAVLKHLYSVTSQLSRPDSKVFPPFQHLGEVSFGISRRTRVYPNVLCSVPLTKPF